MKYAIMTETACQGTIVSCWTEEAGVSVPDLYDTRKEAEEEILDCRRMRMEEQGYTEEEADLMEWVEPVEQYENGDYFFPLSLERVSAEDLRKRCGRT